MINKLWLIIVPVLLISSFSCNKKEGNLKKTVEWYAQDTIKRNLKTTDGQTPSLADYSRLNITPSSIQLKNINTTAADGGSIYHFVKAKITYKCINPSNPKENHNVFHFVALKIIEDGFGAMKIERSSIKEFIITEAMVNQDMFKSRIAYVME